MCWRDINFEKGEIFTPQTNAKTKDSRIIGITPRLRDELEKLWESSPKDEDLLVFGITNTIKVAFKSACKEADIKDFRFHDCRHTATTRMIASGSSHTEVMKITGHTQLKTFLRYLNITSETASNVASRLGDYLAERQSQIGEITEAVN
jgi:integrase